MNFQNATCYKNSFSTINANAATSATIDLVPASATIPITGTILLTANISNEVGGVVSNVTFTSTNAAIASVAPANDVTRSGNTFSTLVTGRALGNVTITASAVMNGSVVNTATSDITVSANSANLTLLPDPLSVQAGSTGTLTATVSNEVGGVVSNVTFSSSNPAVATVNPANDNTRSGNNFNTVVTGVTPGSAVVTAHAIMNGVSVAVATSNISVPAISCTVALNPAAATLAVGSSLGYVAVVNPVGGTVDRVDFSSADVTTVTVSPASDSTIPTYTTTATAVDIGSTTLRANVFMGGVQRCTGTATINTTPTGPWWQVKDSDLSSNGDLSSDMPPASIFGLNGPGGFPGIPAYAGVTNLTTSSVSSRGWLANTAAIGQKTYDYSYFANQIPGGTVINTLNSNSIGGNALSSGGSIDPKTQYYWYKYDGSASGLDLTLTSAVNLGNRKVVLLVNSADFYINSSINLNKGQGFFMALVGKNSGGGKGNIIVDPTVGGGGNANLEGLYMSDGSFSDGVGNTQLWIRGSVVAYGGVGMQRDLGGAANINPSEFFEYAPDQIMLFPSVLGSRRINWKEVAP